MNLLGLSARLDEDRLDEDRLNEDRLDEDRLNRDRRNRDRLSHDCVELHLHGFGRRLRGHRLFGHRLVGHRLFGHRLVGDGRLCGLFGVRLVPEGMENRAGVFGRVPGHVVDTRQKEQAGTVARLAMTLPGFFQRLGELLRRRQGEQPGDSQRFGRWCHASAAESRSADHQVGRVPLGVFEVDLVRGPVVRSGVLLGDPQRPHRRRCRV